MGLQVIFRNLNLAFREGTTEVIPPEPGIHSCSEIQVPLDPGFRRNPGSLWRR